MNTFLSDQLQNKLQLNLQKLKEEKKRITEKRKKLYSEFNSSKTTKAAAFDFLRELEEKETQVDDKLKELESIDLEECTINNINTLFEECDRLLSIEQEASFEDKRSNCSVLREAREKAGLSPTVVAKYIGVSTQRIYNWESPKRQSMPTLTNQMQLGLLYEQDVRDLFPENHYKNMNLALIKARVLAGYSRKELAEKLQTNQSSLAHWEINAQRPNLETQYKIANLLDVDRESLFSTQEKSLLQKFRLQNEMSLEEVAEKTLFSVKTVQAWEDGSQKPSIEAKIAFSELYNCSPEDLGFEIGEKTNVALVKAMNDVHYSMKDLASTLSISLRSVKEWVYRGIVPNREHCEALCKLLDTSIDEVFPSMAKVIQLEDNKHLLFDTQIDNTNPVDLRATRLKLDFSKEWVAEQLGVATYSIGQWELHNSDPQFENRVKLSIIYQVPLKSLFPNRDKKANETLVKLRVNRNLSVEQVCEQIHLSERSLRKYEHGVLIPSKPIQEKLSEFYELPVSFIFPSPANPQKPLATAKPKSKLRALRKEAGLRAEDVAKALGITKSYYSNIEHGSRRPSARLLDKLCAYYDKTPDELLNDYVPPIRQIRLNKGYGLKDVAEYLGINLDTLLDYERGKTPNMETKKTLAKFYGEDVKTLFPANPESYETVGTTALREVRKESRYSAKEVARLNHINPGIYRQMETQSSAKEQGECMQVNRRRLCEFFGKTWEELFPGISQDVRHISDYLHPKSGYHSNGSVMAERRVELGYTQKSLAEKLGKSKGTINQIENGKFRPSEKLVKSIAEALCSDVETLFPDYYNKK